MNLFRFINGFFNKDTSEKEYTPVLVSHQTQLYDESEGGEFLDDGIRMHEQPPPDAEENKGNA